MTPSRPHPAITAIICTHLRASTLPRAIDSLLAQTHDDFEIVVIHDGPMDDATKDVLSLYGDASYVGDDGWSRCQGRPSIPLLALATDESSSYYCVPRNLATTHARGDYIYSLDDDNAATPRALEVMLKAIEEGCVWPDFVYGRLNYVVEPGSRPIHNHRTLPLGPSPLQPWNDAALERLAAGPMSNFIDTSSFMVGRGAMWRLHLATGRMWNEEKRRFGDWELLTRATHFAGWRGKEVDEVVVDYYWGTVGQLQLNRPVNEQVRGEAI